MGEWVDSKDFEHRPMVDWFDLGVLGRAGVGSVVSGAIGAQSDRRETLAALDPEPLVPVEYEADSDGDLWLDFASDVGDGFDSTYAIASLLGRESLEVDGRPLPRGSVLVLGGDQVYPDAGSDEYDHRFLGPYRAAFSDPGPGMRPDLWAIPGNHDWYDGLNGFLRVFCTGHRIGGWQTHQRRSYFAMGLPHRWWLFAIDIQFDRYIDRPQLDYFKQVIETSSIGPDERLILVTSKPSWLKADAIGRSATSWRNLEYFLSNVIEPSGAEVRLMLTGDLHHFSDYACEDGRRLITAGGGGAYLYPTDGLRENLTLPKGRGEFRSEATFPSAEDSRRLTLGALRLPVLAPGLCALVAGFYALIDASAFAALSGFPGIWTVTVLTVLVMALLLRGFAELGGAGKREAVTHTVVHAIFAAAPAIVITGPIGETTFVAGALTTTAAGAIGYALGGLVVGTYLIACHRFARRHSNEVLACQRIPDFKSFVRIRVHPDGLDIFPIGVERVPRAWRVRDVASEVGARFEPMEELEPHIVGVGPMHVPAAPTAHSMSATPDPRDGSR